MDVVAVRLPSRWLQIETLYAKRMEIKDRLSQGRRNKHLHVPP